MFKTIHNLKTRINRSRRGVTLTEALISMGVAAIGMFGVFVLIPFCGRQAEIGLDLHRASDAAKNALETLKAMGFENPDNWVYAAYTNDDPDPMVPQDDPFLLRDGSFDGAFFQARATATDDWVAKSFCIDPFMMSRDTSAVETVTAFADMNKYGPGGTTRHAYEAFQLFPSIDRMTVADPTLPVFGLSTPPMIHRITVANSVGFTLPSGAVVPGLQFYPDPNSTASTNVAAREISEQVFQIADDLNLAEPVDKINPPRQDFLLEGTTPVKRSSIGKMSWMAMVQPDPDQVAPNHYLLNIIVFKDRPRDSMNEFVYEARFNDGTADTYGLGRGYGGGDVRLQVTDAAAGIAHFDGATFEPQPNTVNAKRGDRLTKNRWMMLSRNHPNTNAPLFRWYRVARVGSVEPSVVDPYNNESYNMQTVSLDGPDWEPWDPMGILDNPGGPDPNPAAEAEIYRDYATYIPEVFMVYENTIVIETPSAWSSN